MAKIKGITLERLASIGKALTFSTWKGVPYIKKKTTHISHPRSPDVVRGNVRWIVACRVLKTLDESIIEEYRGWALGSTYSWKDLFMAMYMRYWHKYNQAPITVTKIEKRIIDGQLMCCVWFGNYFAIPGDGYGTLAWGASPYGHATKFYADDGWPLRRGFLVRWCDEPHQKWEPGSYPPDPDDLVA